MRPEWSKQVLVSYTYSPPGLSALLGPKKPNQTCRRMISVTNNKNTRISLEKYQAPGSAVVARWAGNPEARVRFPAGANVLFISLSALLLSSLPDET